MYELNRTHIKWSCIDAHYLNGYLTDYIGYIGTRILFSHASVVQSAQHLIEKIGCCCGCV